MITSLNKNGFIVGKIDSDRLNAAIAPEKQDFNHHGEDHAI